MKKSRPLPETPSRWAELAEQEGVRDKPIHEEKLSSASKITRRQYMLLRVLWKNLPPKKLDYRRLDLEKWINLARKMLNSYYSWGIYLDSFGGKLKEGNFFLVKKSQGDAANVKSEEVSNEVIFSPISKHTRQQSRERRKQLDQTPTKSTSVSLGRLSLEDQPNLPVTPTEDSEEEASDPEPMSTGHSLGPEEARREDYPKVDDEQIVNLATVNFLKALTD